MNRTDRSSAFSDATRKKISDKMKQYHQSMSTEEKRKRADNQRRMMLNYWQHIPPKSKEEDKADIKDIML